MIGNVKNNWNHTIADVYIPFTTNTSGSTRKFECCHLLNSVSRERVIQLSLSNDWEEVGLSTGDLFKYTIKVI